MVVVESTGPYTYLGDTAQLLPAWIKEVWLRRTTLQHQTPLSNLLNIPTIPIPPKSPLDILLPPILLLHPLPTQPPPNTRIRRFPLWTLHRHQLIEILIQPRGLTTAPPGTSRTMPCNIMLIANISEEPQFSFRSEH